MRKSADGKAVVQGADIKSTNTFICGNSAKRCRRRRPVSDKKCPKPRQCPKMRESVGQIKAPSAALGELRRGPAFGSKRNIILFHSEIEGAAGNAQVSRSLADIAVDAAELCLNDLKFNFLQIFTGVIRNVAGGKQRCAALIGPLGLGG